MTKDFLPKSFPKGTTFFDVDGVAVELSPDRLSAVAWAPGKPGRRFPAGKVETDGWPPLSEADFRALVIRLAQT